MSITCSCHIFTYSVFWFKFEQKWVGIIQYKHNKHTYIYEENMFLRLIPGISPKPDPQHKHPEAFLLESRDRFCSYSWYMGLREGGDNPKNPLLHLNPLLFDLRKNDLKSVETSSERLWMASDKRTRSHGRTLSWTRLVCISEKKKSLNEEKMWSSTQVGSIEPSWC